MEAYQKRVITEHKELSEKIYKLRTFIGNHALTGSSFGFLPADEQRRLARQFAVMLEYQDILSQRIAAWGSQDAA